MAQTTADGTQENDGNKDSWPGMFNFQEVMNKFYDYTPDGDDDFGNAIKQTFASNMVQSAFDKEMSKEMGSFQNALGQSNMKMAADLELANNSSMMQQEFNYGMQSMGAQFDLQNSFANSQFDRDVAMTAAQGEDTRKTQDNQAYNARLQEITSGEQSRLTDTNRVQQEGEQNRQNLAVQGGEQRLTDSNRIQNEGNEARETLSAKGEQDRLNITTTGSEQRLTDSNRLRTEGEETRANTKVQGSEQRLTDTNKITTTAAEGRNTMDFQNRLEAKTRADQNKYSRGTARGF